MKKTYCFAFGVAAILLLIGTFIDLHISLALYNPDSSFGNFFAVAGMVPLWTLIALSTGLMFGALLIQFENLNFVWRLVCTGLLVYGVYATYRRTAGSYSSRHLNGLPPYMLIYLVIATFMLATVLGVYASRKYPEAVIIAAIVGIITISGGRMIVNELKEVWGRQRFWTMDNPIEQFTVWYLPLFPSTERLKEMGDKIASFPSGHSFGGITVLWFSMFPSFLDCCQKNRKAWSNALAVFALCFWVLVMLSRIVLGEHFLSDVVASGIIYLTLFLSFNVAFERVHSDFYRRKEKHYKKQLRRVK